MRILGKLLWVSISCLFVGCASDIPSVDGQASTSGNAPSSSEVLKFSAIPDQNRTELKEKFDALAKHLGKELGIEVEYVASTDYKASVDAFKNADIQLAWFGGLTGVQARSAVQGSRAIVQGRSDPNFFSYFIAHADTGLAKASAFPADLGNLSFAFGSASSTSGRLMPEFFIRENTGKSPDALFRTRPVFSGSHDKTVELVESGQVQAGVVNFKVYEKRVAQGKTDANKCKVIWVTPKYADYNFTAHPILEKRFGAGFIDKLQATLIAIRDPMLLSAFPREALIEAKNEDFAEIENVARELGFLR